MVMNIRNVRADTNDLVGNSVSTKTQYCIMTLSDMVVVPSISCLLLIGKLDLINLEHRYYDTRFPL